MAPMYQAARINSKSLVLKAAAGMAEESARKEQIKKELRNTLLEQLSLTNKTLHMIDRLIAVQINQGKQVDFDLAHKRRALKEEKQSLAKKLKGLR